MRRLNGGPHAAHIAGTTFGLMLLTMACGDDASQMRNRIGQHACNATNGVYRGRVVEVSRVTGPDGSAADVFVIEREGSRHNAPPDNVTFGADCDAKSGQ